MRRRKQEKREARGYLGAALKLYAIAIIGLVMVCVLASGGVAPLFAADADRAGLVNEGRAVQQVTVTLNKSRTFNVERPFARARRPGRGGCRPRAEWRSMPA